MLAGAVVALALLPLGFVIWSAVQTGWSEGWALIVRPRVGELLVNTLLLEVLAVPLAIAVAGALAWLVERTDLPARKWFGWLAVAPLAVPAFVQSYSWNTVVPGLHGLPAAVLISVLAYYPFLYLPIAAQLRRIDPALEDTAASMGLGPWAVFWRVIVPQMRLAMLGGALLVSLHLLSEFGLYAMIRFNTFATAIVDQFQSVYSGAAAHMLSGVLVLLCLGLLGLEGRLRGTARFARVGAGAARLPIRRALGRYRIIGVAIPVVVAALAVGVPLFVLLRWTFAGGVGVWLQPAFAGAIVQTIVLALGGAAFATLAALPVAWLSVRAPGKVQRVFEAAHYYIGALPGVVIALALVSITVRTMQPLYQTAITLLLAYVLMFLPRALVGLRSSLAQAPVELEQAATSLGRRPASAMMATTMRLSAPGVAASMALVALGITNELTATLMLAPNGTQTLATRFWALTSELDYAAAAPYAVLMVVLSLPLTLLVRSESERMAGR